jgi:hypothetical protein
VKYPIAFREELAFLALAAANEQSDLIWREAMLREREDFTR